MKTEMEISLDLEWDRFLVGEGSMDFPVEAVEPAEPVVEARYPLHLAQDRPVLTGELRKLEHAFKPLKVDELGPDPFEIRRWPTERCLCPHLPDPNNADEMSEFLFQFDRVGNPKRVFSTSGPVPGILHYVWLGSQLKRLDFRENVEKWASNHPSFEVVIWTDQTEFDGEMKKWCKDNCVRLLNIYEALPVETMLGLECAFMRNAAKMRPNWGESSDLLRYALMYNFGGVYADLDTPSGYLKSEVFEQQWNDRCGFKLPLDFKGKDYSLIPVANDCLIARPLQPFFRQVCNMCKERVALNYRDVGVVVSKTVDVFNPNEQEIAETVGRSGPSLLHAAFVHFTDSEDDFIRDKKNFRAETNGETTCTGSWLHDSRLVLDCKLTDRMLEGIVTELLWDLHNNSEKFNLNKFEPWIERSDDPGSLRRSLYDFVRLNHPRLLIEVKGVEVKDVVLFESICHDLELDSQRMGDACMQAAKWEHMEMLEYFLIQNPSFFHSYFSREGLAKGSSLQIEAFSKGKKKVFDFLTRADIAIEREPSIENRITLVNGQIISKADIAYAASVNKVDLLTRILVENPETHELWQFIEGQIRAKFEINEAYFRFQMQHFWVTTDKIPAWFKRGLHFQFICNRVYIEHMIEECGSNRELLLNRLHNEVDWGPYAFEDLARIDAQLASDYFVRELQIAPEREILHHFIYVFFKYFTFDQIQEAFLVIVENRSNLTQLLSLMRDNSRSVSRNQLEFFSSENARPVFQSILDRAKIDMDHSSRTEFLSNMAGVIPSFAKFL